MRTLRYLLPRFPSPLFVLGCVLALVQQEKLASLGELTAGIAHEIKNPLNFVGNAFDATREHAASVDGQYAPRVTVTTRRRDDSEVAICVKDNGPGIPKVVREKIFEPFFTTKPTGEETGLGLSMSHDIITQGHGGTLAVESAEGAAFVVRLPAEPVPASV